MPVEKCGPRDTITCWAGGTNAWQQTDWSAIGRRDVSLLADGDEPGCTKQCSHWHCILARLGCAVSNSTTTRRIGL